MTIHAFQATRYRFALIGFAAFTSAYMRSISERNFLPACGLLSFSLQKRLVSKSELLVR